MENLFNSLKETNYSNQLDLWPDENIIQKLEEFANSNEQLEKNVTKSEIATFLLEQYSSIKKYPGHLIIFSVILSSIAMAAGIAALVWGWWFSGMSDELTYIVMIVESAIAALALGWTVAVVIKMLAEPGEKKATEK